MADVVIADPISGMPGAPTGPQADVMTDADRHRLLLEWNATAAEFPAERCVHELVEEQAARRPEATAVVVGERSLTYAELDRRANHLAHHLRALGVGREVVVGICAERGL